MGRRYTIKRKKLIEIIYLLILCSYAAVTVLGSSNVSNVLFMDKALLYSLILKCCAPLLFVLFLVEGKVNKKKLMIMGFLSIVVIAVTFQSENRGLATMYAAIPAYPTELETKKASRWLNRTLMVFTLIVIISYLLGNIESDITLRGSITRNSCGFTSANAFGNTVFIWMVMYVYTKYSEWSWRTSVFCLSIILAVFQVTNSRMSFILELFLIVMVHIFLWKKGKVGNWIYKVATMIYPISTLFCLGITIAYQRGIASAQLSALNVLLSYRLGFMRKYYSEYGVKLFGQVVETVSRARQLSTGEAWSGLDNSYMYIMICWGLVISIILCFLYYKLGQFLKVRGDFIGALCVISLCLVGLTESYLSNIAYNFAALLVAKMLSTPSFLFVREKYGNRTERENQRRYDSEQGKRIVLSRKH